MIAPILLVNNRHDPACLATSRQANRYDFAVNIRALRPVCRVLPPYRRRCGLLRLTRFVGAEEESIIALIDDWQDRPYLCSDGDGVPRNRLKRADDSYRASEAVGRYVQTRCIGEVSFWRQIDAGRTSPNFRR
jgi:hypothetical protein